MKMLSCSFPVNSWPNLTKADDREAIYVCLVSILASSSDKFSFLLELFLTFFTQKGGCSFKFGRMIVIKGMKALMWRCRVSSPV